MKLIQVAFLLSAVLAQFASAQSTGIAMREFNSDYDFAKANSVRLPRPVLAVLLASPEAKAVESEAGKSWVRDHRGEDNSGLFDAFPVNLSTAPQERDWVAVGKWEHLIGADNSWFWVVRSFSSRPRVVLFCGALTVSVLSGMHHSLRDIRCTFETPGGDGYIRDYRFDGQRYILAKDIRTQRRP